MSREIYYFVRHGDGSLETRAATVSSAFMHARISKLIGYNLFLVCENFRRGELYTIEDMDQNVYYALSLDGNFLTDHNQKLLNKWFLEMPFSNFAKAHETSQRQFFDWRHYV